MPSNHPSNDGSPPAPATSPTQNLVDAVMAETIGMSMHNAVTAQNNMRMLANAAVTAACARIVNTPGGPPAKSPPISPAPPGSSPLALGGPDAGGGGAGSSPHVTEDGANSAPNLAAMVEDAEAAAQRAEAVVHEASRLSSESPTLTRNDT